MSLVIAVAIWAVIKSQVQRQPVRIIPGGGPGGGSTMLQPGPDPRFATGPSARLTA